MPEPTILIVNQRDTFGGAARNSWDLFQGLRQKGVSAYMAVGQKNSNDPAVQSIPNLCPNPYPWSRLLWNIGRFFQPYEGKVRGAGRLRFILQTLASPGTELQSRRGWENLNFPGSHRILDLFPHKIDLVHLHNLHSQYFDLRFLPALSQRVPTMLTLLDTWLFAGHCGYSMGCERWLTGCGSCPYLSLYSPIRRDASDFNWQRKKEIYSRTRLFIAAPCKWMGERMDRSILKPTVREVRIIPSGTDQSIFHPANKQQIRRELGLPLDARILLFVGQGTKANPFKDFATMEKAIHLVSARVNENVLFVSLGHDGKPEEIEEASIKHIPYTFDMAQVAKYYQAADIYLHAAHEDTFPNVVLEALSCGLPVIGTAIGGIPEQIVDGETGFLIPPWDAELMADRIVTLLSDNVRCQQMGEKALEFARQNFNIELTVSRYREYYAHVLEANTVE